MNAHIFPSAGSAANPDWARWAHFLRRWNLNQLTADLLESAGPLTLLAAQLVYLAQPLFKSSSLAQMLEDENQSQAFSAFLRQEDPK